MGESEEIFRQIENQKYIQNQLGTEQWIMVSGHKDMNGADAGFYCGFIDLNHIDTVFRSADWDIGNDCNGPGFEENARGCEYKRVLLEDGLVPLLHFRQFYEVKPDYVEIDQEFVLLNNLWFDAIDNKYYAMYDSGDQEEAVRYIDPTTVLIKLKFLRKYAAAKQLAILLFFDIRTSSAGTLEENHLSEFRQTYKKENLYYDAVGSEISFPREVFSRLLGKKILFPKPVEECGFWPYEAKQHYEEFIIGTDENGDEVRYTSDPDKLANYFGANPEAPFYLTPVFFKREVLQKYIEKPELYRVRDGYLECGSLWGMEIDNHHRNCISAYLGDLGRDLPESEQVYWKGYNIVCDEGLSETSIQRDFFNIPAESSMIDHRFQADYIKLNKAWKEHFGWDLFKPLDEGDKYIFSQIRIPFSDSQPEFDNLILNLTKVLIDSLNEKAIGKEIIVEPDMAGITKLERWLQTHEYTNCLEHIQFLRDLQELRSKGTAHRKGKEYNKLTKKFGMIDQHLSDVFEDILKKADAFLVYMQTIASEKTE